MYSSIVYQYIMHCFTGYWNLFHSGYFIATGTFKPLLFDWLSHISACINKYKSLFQRESLWEPLLIKLIKQIPKTDCYLLMVSLFLLASFLNHSKTLNHSFLLVNHSKLSGYYLKLSQIHGFVTKIYENNSKLLGNILCLTALWKPLQYEPL